MGSSYSSLQITIERVRCSELGPFIVIGITLAQCLYYVVGCHIMLSCDVTVIFMLLRSAITDD